MSLMTIQYPTSRRDALRVAVAYVELLVLSLSCVCVYVSQRWSG